MLISAFPLVYGDTPGLRGLDTHCPIFIVERRSRDGQLRRLGDRVVARINVPVILPALGGLAVKRIVDLRVQNAFGKRLLKFVPQGATIRAPGRRRAIVGPASPTAGFVVEQAPNSKRRRSSAHTDRTIAASSCKYGSPFRGYGGLRGRIPRSSSLNDGAAMAGFVVRR
jgi:hypothetical protein